MKLDEKRQYPSGQRWLFSSPAAPTRNVSAHLVKGGPVRLLLARELDDLVIELDEKCQSSPE